MHVARSTRPRGLCCLPLALAVEIYTIDLPLHLIKTYIVETLETRTTDRPHPVVRNQEVLLPAHEDVFALGDVLDDDRGALACLFGVGSERGELGPVGEIRLVVGTPALVLGHEAIFGPNDFALEVCRQRGMVVGEPYERS